MQHRQRHHHQAVETQRLVERLVELSSQGELDWTREVVFDELWNMRTYECKYRGVRFRLRHRDRLTPSIWKLRCDVIDQDGDCVPVHLPKLARLKLLRAAKCSVRAANLAEREREALKAANVVARVTAKQADLVGRMLD